MKYDKPPVRYATVKIIFKNVIGNFLEEDYTKLLVALSDLKLVRNVISKGRNIVLQPTKDSVNYTEAKFDVLGMFSASGTRCAYISEKFIEFRLTEYDNHKNFLDDANRFYQVFTEQEFAKENPIKEIEVHYVDHFIPINCELSDMFENVSLPVGQFYFDTNDYMKVGGINFTRILESKMQKVQVAIEQFTIPAQNEGTLRQLPKALPDSLAERDSKMVMPGIMDFPIDSVGKQYAIVHTSGSKLFAPEEGALALRGSLEELYKECRKTFDKMTNDTVCNKVWQAQESE